MTEMYRTMTGERNSRNGETEKDKADTKVEMKIFCKMAAVTSKKKRLLTRWKRSKQ